MMASSFCFLAIRHTHTLCVRALSAQRFDFANINGTKLSVTECIRRQSSHLGGGWEGAMDGRNECTPRWADANEGVRFGCSACNHVHGAHSKASSFVPNGFLVVAFATSVRLHLSPKPIGFPSSLSQRMVFRE